MLAALPALGQTRDLAPVIDRMIERSAVAERATIGVHVVDLRTGNTLYGHNEETLFLPASNMKLFTSALALTTLGPQYRFETRLLLTPEGDLVLVGSGDPSISSRDYPYTKNGNGGDPLAPLDALVDQAIAAGLTEVPGDVVGDDRAYPWSPYPNSWTEDDMLFDYGAPVSALSFNDNVFSITVRPGAGRGQLSLASITPKVEYFAIDNRVTTVAGSGNRIRVERVPGKRQFLLRGTIGVRSGPVGFTRAVDDPALFTATALYDALLRRGVPVRGHPVARHRGVEDPEDAAGEVHGDLLAVRQSPPLSQLLEVLEKVSQNLHAELMLREVGRVSQGQGTVDAGLKAMAEMLKVAGVPDGEFHSEDGSGLARNDEVTPHALTHLLSYMANSIYSLTWMSYLPIGGVDGTLERRLCCAISQTRVHAKTGSLSRSVALSGYAMTASGEQRAFSILVNNFSTPSSAVRSLVDKIALVVAE